MEKKHLLSSLEALLFVSGEALSFTRLMKTLRIPESELREAVGALKEKYAADEERGLMLMEKGDQVMLATKPENAAAVEDLTKSTLSENLSKAGLEVLAIIAYRAPITRSEIEAIRGVNCSFTLRNLLLRDLIERQGNPHDARGYVYQPSFRLLQVLGLSGTKDLPEYETLSQDERLKVILEGVEEVSGESHPETGKSVDSVQEIKETEKE